MNETTKNREKKKLGCKPKPYFSLNDAQYINRMGTGISGACAQQIGMLLKNGLGGKYAIFTSR
jgi:hypothetical protein